MIIAIAHTKIGQKADYAYRAFEEGAKAHGDSCVHITSHDDIKKIKDCDIVFQVAYPFLAHKYVFCDEFGFGKSPIPPENVYSQVNTFRLSVFDEAIKYRKRLLSIDSALLGFKRETLDSYYQISFDSIKGLGKYYNENSPSDRFEKLNIEVKPWRKNGNHILTHGQVLYGVGSQHVDINKWMKKFIVNYFESPNRKIKKHFFRGHPNAQHSLKSDQKVQRMVSFSKDTLEADFTNCWCSVTFCSHIIAESIVRGIPCISCSKTSMGYPLFHSDNPIEDCMNPPMPDRQQWLNDIAYTQWHTDEIKDGTAWAHYRQHALKTADVDWDKHIQLAI